jgi:hypothetical protein
MEWARPSSSTSSTTRGLDVMPFCPFVNAYIENHREYADLVPETQREAFGL